MKKAVILSGGKQYLVTEGDVLDVDKILDTKITSLKPLLVIDDNSVEVGKPSLDKMSVSINIEEPEILADKVIAIRYKAKKRVNKIRGHRQKLTRIKIVKIA